MRRALVLLLLLVLLFVTPFGDDRLLVNPHVTYIPSQGLYDIERNWTLNVVIVGYEQSVIDEAILLSGMPTERVYVSESVDITYNIDYNIEYADTTYYNDLHTVMLENSVNGTGTGTWLNQTALQYQKDHLDEPQRIFYPRDGRVIDAFEVEDWLIENPVVNSPSLGYTLYLVNFSMFDTPALEHWYDYHPVDPDTGEEQDWFRLEWDNALNPDVTMDYPSFGGRYNIHVVDPSAHQWYLKWCKIWWSESITTEYDFWTQDLEDKMATLDMGVPADVDTLNVYLSECIWDPINLLFFPYQHQPAKYVQSGRLTGLVFCMDVSSGVSIDSLEWVTDAEMLKNDLEELYPFIDWTVDIEFLDINNEPAWNTLFWMHSYIDSGTTIVDGGAMFDTIYDVMRPQYVADDENINVFSVVFIKKQMEMHVYGRTYTGLGGQGQAVIWKSWERYYRPDGVTPKDGVSSVQLHETMHAIGFLHTWQHEQYSSDFSWGPMGYFAFRPGTATYDKNWVQGTYLDQMEAILWDEFLTQQALLGGSERPETYLAEQGAIKSFDEARSFYNQMDWMSAFEALSEARDWMRRMMYSQVDDTPPVILSYSVNPEEIPSQTYYYSAIISDNLAGVENASLFVQFDGGDIYNFPCTNSSNNWSVTFTVPPEVAAPPPVNRFQNMTMWLVAHDWGMNSATGGRIELLTPSFRDFYELLFPIAVAGATCIIVIGVGVYLMRRRR
ncbi:MAG: hypothetical protein ACFFF9_11825 [Candidatus Thorarchaeota archaeon]